MDSHGRLHFWGDLIEGGFVAIIAVAVVVAHAAAAVVVVAVVVVAVVFITVVVSATVAVVVQKLIYKFQNRGAILNQVVIRQQLL